MNRTTALLFPVLLTAGLFAGLPGCDEQKARESEVQPAKAAGKPEVHAPKAGVGNTEKVQAAEAEAKPVAVDKQLLVQFGKLPGQFDNPKNAITREKVSLGKKLYFDKRFSKNQDMSCASCHSLSTFGVDGAKTSEGHKKQHGDRNSPTVLNAGGGFVQFWDGRAADVEAQALGPVVNPVEMAMPSLAALETNLRAIPDYAPEFKAAFPKDAQPVTAKNFGAAIGAFERTLVTPSRFDKYLAGDDAALTSPEKEGLVKFMDVGCPTCHTGALLGASEFKKLGLAIPWPIETDQGKFRVSKLDTDKMLFKVQSLRNVTETAPYFHDGSVVTLDEAVKLMAKHQLGKNLTAGEVKSIVAFLGSLKGEVNEDWKKEPELPASGPGLIKPDPT